MALLIDVVTHSVTGVTNELSEIIEKLPKEKQQRIINAVRALVESGEIFDRKEEKRDAVCTGIAVDFP